MARTVLHFSTAADGGAGRAARRAHRASVAAGVLSSFAFLDGRPDGPDEILFRPAPPEGAAGALAGALHGKVQWGMLQGARRGASNTLFSIPHPGVALDRQALAAAADILHLHWTSWGAAPASVARWLADGRRLVWTLHDLWPMTGGCHYPDGCEQYRTACMACPQLQDAWSLVPNAFAEKRAAWSDPALVAVAPSRWMAARAAESAILGAARIVVLPNAVETDVFAPRADRAALRAAWGVAEADVLVVAGAFDNRERRKGGALLAGALARLMADPELPVKLGPGARIVVAGFGRHVPAGIGGMRSLAFGEVTEDEVLADILAAADLAVIPSLEDNYPNIAVEALSCGTPVLATPVGGLAELVREGRSGLLAAAATEDALAAAFGRFLARYRGDPELRAGARAQAEAENALPVVGAQLARLYEEVADAPRTGGTTAAAHARARRAFARAPVGPAGPSAAFLRFPLNHLLAAEAPDAVTAETTPLPRRAAGQPAVLALRTLHAHHGARSGAAQFLRHLPAAMRVEMRATPLGDVLAGGAAADFRRWGRLMGAVPFGQQGNAWLAEAEVLAAAAAEPYDVLHAIDGEHALALLARMPAALFHGRRRPAMAATFHQPPALLGGMVSRAALGALDAVVVLCEAQRAALAAWVAPSRLHLIPHGIDTGFFTPGPRPAREGGMRLLSVGHWLRDHAAAFEALRILRAQGVAARLRLVTPQPPVSLPEDVIVEAGLSDEDLRAAYRDADALLLPLTDATANNAVLEAMACGLPVVSTDIGGVAEMTGGAALLAPPGDAAALARHVQTLARDPSRAAGLARAGRTRAEALDWRHIAARYAALYRALAEARA